MVQCVRATVCISLTKCEGEGSKATFKVLKAGNELYMFYSTTIMP